LECGAPSSSSNHDKPPQELLSVREFHVLCLIASGKLVSEIARELSLSVKTISTYRARILEKMGMSNNAQLMRYAMQHHLVA
jgi:two-component system, NarL family, invasion response regulator UvrY